MKAVIVACGLLFAGCASARRGDVLESYFQGLQVQVRHGSYLVGGEIRPTSTKPRAERAILAYLNGSDPAVGTAFPPPDLLASHSPRPRDFWALMLAKLWGEELDLSVSDTAAVKDGKIDALLLQEHRPPDARN